MVLHLAAHFGAAQAKTNSMVKGEVGAWSEIEGESKYSSLWMQQQSSTNIPFVL